MNNPSVWSAILTDPTVPFDRDALWHVVRDQRRGSRRWLYPLLRRVGRLAVALVRMVKPVLPSRLSAHSTMDTLCVWFLRRFVSPEAGRLLLRHFVVETNLLNFIVANTEHAGVPVELRPLTLTDLGNRAVIQHDVNVYDVLIGLGLARHAAPPVPRPVPVGLEFGMLAVPPLDADEGRRRWLNLDIQSALCLMNIPFAACLTAQEYERAVHSLTLDDSLLTVLAELTGDPTFWRWRRGTITVRVDAAVDVPRAVYGHAVICEHAHARLRQLAAAQERLWRDPMAISASADRPHYLEPQTR